jgi:hypothetical protein
MEECNTTLHYTTLHYTTLLAVIMTGLHYCTSTCTTALESSPLSHRAAAAAAGVRRRAMTGHNRVSDTHSLTHSLNTARVSKSNTAWAYTSRWHWCSHLLTRWSRVMPVRHCRCQHFFVYIELCNESERVSKRVSAALTILIYSQYFFL